VGSSAPPYAQAPQQQLQQQQMQMLPETFAVPADCFRVLASDSAQTLAKCSLSDSSRCTRALTFENFRQGSRIASIESMCGAKIEYAKWKQTFDSNHTWLAIYGEPQNVTEAYNMLAQVVEDLRQRLGLLGQQQSSDERRAGNTAMDPPIDSAHIGLHGMHGRGLHFDAMTTGITAGGVDVLLQPHNSLAVPQHYAQQYALSAPSQLDLVSGHRQIPGAGGEVFGLDNNMQLLQQQRLKQQQLQSLLQQQPPPPPQQGQAMVQGTVHVQLLERHQQQQLQHSPPLSQQQPQQRQQQPQQRQQQVALQKQPPQPQRAGAPPPQQPADAAVMDVADTGEDASKAEKKRTVSFKVPSAVAGLIVGKKGVGIKKFKQQAGVKISLPYGEGAEKATPQKTVVIEGAAPRVDAGISLLCETLSAWAEKDPSVEHQVFLSPTSLGYPQVSFSCVPPSSDACIPRGHRRAYPMASNRSPPCNRSHWQQISPFAPRPFPMPRPSRGPPPPPPAE
jgi:hypothetical protein